MSDAIKDGGPAFPRVEPIESRAIYYGMSLRDYFAAEALKGVLYMAAHGSFEDNAGNSPEGISMLSYTLADAMLRAGEKK